ncbi:teichoic acid transport system permease protein [Weissella uvarum]|uniref:ABC transporter permease n=1 Tax=Weissella uvarum TaxID=1479233 RepID=UPI00196183D9|nr:ABC transporter permease [Weissella uvarum]MBM7616579.1 teichoic acid transport system permease protein [Weissella uvarum]MCM0594961.1 ABC transporter permease [Weissella uvarum]
MINALKILWEQITHLPLIVRMVKFGDQSTYKNFILGQTWKFVNPILQVTAYFLMFGLGLRQVSMPGAPTSSPLYYLAWMLFGMAMWRFINEAVMSGSQAIKRQLGLVTKMKFPMSILPSVSIGSSIWTLIVLTVLGVVMLLLTGQPLSPNWPYVIYYLLASFLFIYSFDLINSTILIIIPDYISILRLVMSMGMWFAGVIFNLNLMNNAIGDILRLTPFYYLIGGYRDALFAPDASFASFFTPATIIFWSTVAIFMIVGAYLHLRYKDDFVEYK